MRKAGSLNTDHSHRLTQDAHELLGRYADHLPEAQPAQATAHLLASWKVRPSVVAAALIVPLVYRGLVSDTELREQLGDRAVTLAHGVARLLYSNQTVGKQIRAEPKAHRTEKLRRFFIEAYTDVESALICAAARLVSMESAKNMSAAAREAWAQENMAIYLPLLELLGLWQSRRELGNYSLELGDPVFFSELKRSVENHRTRHRALFRRIQLMLQDIFESAGIIDAEFSLHDNTPISLSQRLEQAQRRGNRLRPDNVNILSIDVIVQTEDDCYRALGLIHNRWRPAIRQSAHKERRLQDYIALPRYNGYRCLITTIETEDVPPPEQKENARLRKRPARKLVEFRIRTQQMEQINNYGLIYALQDGSQIRNVWWTDNRAREFVRIGNTETLKTMNEIAIFTPTGEVIHPLPKGSTVIDVAFRIHSALGPYARSFLVNGRSVPFRHELNNRDLVEIEFDLTFPSLEAQWEQYARTENARTNIQRFLRQQNRAPHRGRERINKVLQREMDIYKLRFPEEKVEMSLKAAARHFNCPTLDTLYMQVLESRISPDKVVAHMIQQELVGHIVTESGERPNVRQIVFSHAWMQEHGNRKYAPENRVIPGCEIVGHIRPNAPGTMIVHNVLSARAPRNNVVPLRWRTTDTLREFAEITITTPVRKQALGKVINMIDVIGKDEPQKRVFINHVTARDVEGNHQIELNIDAPSLGEIGQIQASLAALQRQEIISNFKVWQLFPGQKKQIASQRDRRSSNPYTLKLIRDHNMFYGREQEIQQVIDHVLSHESHFIVLHGQQRIGKTTLLYQLTENYLPQACNVLPVLLDLQSVSPCTTGGIFMALADATMKKLTERLHRAGDRRALRLRLAELERAPYVAFANWVHKIENRLNGTKLLFVIDEFTITEDAVISGVLDQRFHNGLQYLIDIENVGFLLCIHDHVYNTKSRGWGLYQRGQLIHLQALDEQAARQLIQTPLERHYTLEDGVVEAIIRMTDRHPYFIHAICQTLVGYASKGESAHITHETLAQARNLVLTSGDHYFRYLRVQVGGYEWEILRIVANATVAQEWISTDKIRQQLQRARQPAETRDLAIGIGHLRNLGLLRERAEGTFEYQIPIGIFAYWICHVVTEVKDEPTQADDQARS